MSSSKNGEGVHILLIPYPAQGHILPFLDFTHQLALRGITITILITPKNLPILDPLLSTHPSIQTLVLPFPAGHPLLPAGVEHVKDLGNWGNVPIISSLTKLRAPVVEWFRSHPNPPAAIIHDSFSGWAQDVAGEIGVPGICFNSTAAFLVCVFDCAWKNIKGLKSMEVVGFPEMPNSPSFVRDHLPSIIKNYKESDPDWETIRSGMVENTGSWGFIVNTFGALEGKYLEWLEKKKKKENRVFSIGPLSLIGVPHGGGGGDQRSLFSWLEGCPDESVLYVAFGSQKLMKKPQLEALTIGLEKSGVRFVLVVKEPTVEQVAQGYGSVPAGFEDRVTGRGLVIRGWAPQVEILSHRAVGGFLSHCGWNSTLEAIAAGVLILGWPMEADQYVNVRLLVDELGVSVRVSEGADTVPDTTELAKIISESMNGHIVEKVRAKELRDKACDAVKVGGSSMKALDGLVEQLSQLNSPSNSG
ncbi:PREDICTED: UDP-glycosyltransferase 89A2-like [Ipomoea nil]|uniref:UDP-glycosyltransferase 89A2-like n=1 Tax=Ipomoea nil TaxID=35883 RepID=UPI000901C340|nr:PREDICTED: UDP-glycosyltransferase 89A2-like [Ipomoea nil]